jgi:hypothetical protein
MHSLYTILSYPQRKGKIIEGLKIFVTLNAFASLFNLKKKAGVVCLSISLMRKTNWHIHV